MTSNRNLFVATSVTTLAIAALAGSASAATPPVFGGSHSGTTTNTATNVGAPTTVATGSGSVAPYTTVVTTTQKQNNTSSTTGSSPVSGTTSTGIAYTGTLAVSGAGTNTQNSVTTSKQLYNPGPPPTPVGAPVAGGPTITNISAQTVTSISASGSASSPNFGTGLFADTLATSGPITNNSVTATENATTIQAGGTTYQTYVGTATYNPGAGTVTVSLPSTATNTTTVNGGGVTTNGTVTAGTLTSTGDIHAAGEVYSDSVDTNVVNVTGAVNAATVSTTGNVSVGNNLTVAGSTYVSGNEHVAGEVYSDSVDTTGNVNVGNNLNVSGNSYITGNEHANGVYANTFQAADSYGNTTVMTSTGLSVNDGHGDYTNVTAGGVTTNGAVSANTVNANTVNANTVNTNEINMNGGQIHDLGNGTAPGDAVNLYQLQAGLNNLRKVAAGGTAVAAAMSGNYFIPGKKLNFNINLADYGDQGAFAANIGYLITPSIAINAGVATGFEYGATAGRIGATMGF